MIEELEVKGNYQDIAKIAAFWVDVDGIKYPVYSGHVCPKIIKDTGEIVQVIGAVTVNYAYLARCSYEKLKPGLSWIKVGKNVDKLAASCSTGYLGVGEVLQALVEEENVCEGTD